MNRNKFYTQRKQKEMAEKSDRLCWGKTLLTINMLAGLLYPMRMRVIMFIPLMMYC